MHQSTLSQEVRQELEKKLLTFGGKRAVFYGPEPHADLLIQRGRLFTEPVERRPGKRGKCHINAARLWARASTKHHIVTGYALSTKKVWIPHSWVLHKGVLYETTGVWNLYFGVELDDMDAVRFWAENLFFREYPQCDPPPSYFNRRRRLFKLLDESRAELEKTLMA